jgi:hypothetical protein
LIACTFYVIFMCLLCNLGTSLLCPPVSLERTLQVSIGEDRKSRSSDCFSVLASLNSYGCDLTFSYDVISILHVLFVFFNNKK